MNQPEIMVRFGHASFPSWIYYRVPSTPTLLLMDFTLSWAFSLGLVLGTLWRIIRTKGPSSSSSLLWWVRHFKRRLQNSMIMEALTGGIFWETVFKLNFFHFPQCFSTQNFKRLCWVRHIWAFLAKTGLTESVWEWRRVCGTQKFPKTSRSRCWITTILSITALSKYRSANHYQSVN